MKRFFNWLKALFNRAMDKVEDPEMMLDQARRDMQQALIQNREKAVQAITQKNRLQNMLEEESKKAERLEQQAATALRQGNRELARQFLREKANVDANIQSLTQTHAQAIETVEGVKKAIKHQEQEVRRKTAEALAMKAQWKQAQIQTSISKALEGLTFESQFEGSFAAAKERIQEKQAEAAARNEMMSTSLHGKMMAMEDQAMDFAAEEELVALEEKLGLRQPNVDASTTTTQVPAENVESTVDAELEELEKRLQQGQ